MQHWLMVVLTFAQNILLKLLGGFLQAYNFFYTNFLLVWFFLLKYFL